MHARVRVSNAYQVSTTLRLSSLCCDDSATLLHLPPFVAEGLMHAPQVPVLLAVLCLLMLRTILYCTTVRTILEGYPDLVQDFLIMCTGARGQSVIHARLLKNLHSRSHSPQCKYLFLIKLKLSMIIVAAVYSMAKRQKVKVHNEYNDMYFKWLPPPPPPSPLYPQTSG